MLEEQEGTLNHLPEDVLANILGRLAPRFLATSRCVCKPWCTIIDTHRLLRTDLLPLSLAGIFINFDHRILKSAFFSRSSTGPIISNCLPPRYTFSRFSAHCNGLLLIDNYVVNPATCQWEQLPPFPSSQLGTKSFFHKEYLAFDPAVSPHYEVFLIPFACARSGRIKLNPATEELEWPLSPCTLHVFSSRTKKWEERSFFREGEAAGTVADMRLDDPHSNRYHNSNHHHSVYWRGALYVHCQTNFVMRISLLDGKYQVVKPPLVDTELIPDPNLCYLGKSQKGVYCALKLYDHYVYVLDESYGKMEWVLKTTIDLSRYGQTDRPKPWTLQDINFGGSHDEYQDDNDEVMMEENFELGCGNNNVVETNKWDSDDDNVIDTEDWGNTNFSSYIINFLGFHPYKEVVFLCEGFSQGLAYHLNTSKVQELGDLSLSPTHYGTGVQPFIERSFPYTPWMGEFPQEN